VITALGGQVIEELVLQVARQGRICLQTAAFRWAAPALFNGSAGIRFKPGSAEPAWMPGCSLPDQLFVIDPILVFR